MRRYSVIAMMVLASSLLVFGCSSDSSTEPTQFSTNISGTWSGTTSMFGSTVAVTLSVTQATSGRAAFTAQALTGMLTLNSGTPLPMTGTKNGDVWDLCGNAGTTIASIHQTLTSATESTGDLTLQIGPPSNKGTVSLALTKS